MRIPLIGSLASRDSTNTALYGTGKDQSFKDCTFTVYKNEATGRTTPRVYGRQSYALAGSPASASGAGTAIRLWRYQSGTPITAFGSTNSTIYSTSASLGTITGQAKFIDEAFATVATLLISSTDKTAWYYPSDAGTGSPTFTGDLNSSVSITNVVSTAGVYVGQTVTHANIPGGTVITAISGATITISQAATATAAAQSITRTPIAKILDTDYPGNATPSRVPTGRFAVLDGIAYQMDTTGQIWGSDINNIASYDPLSFIVTQETIDLGIGCVRYGNGLLALSSSSVEMFQNTGNPVGSSLTRVQEGTSHVGCVNQYAYCEFGDTVAFIGKERGLPGVYLMDGLKPRRISDQTMDAWLTATDLTNARLNVLSSYGVPVLAVTSASNATSCYVWHSNVNMWHPWALEYGMTQSDTIDNPSAHGARFVGSDATQTVTNAAAPASGTIQTGEIDFDSSNVKRFNRLSIVGDRAASTLNLSVSWSTDNYKNFSTARTIDASQTKQQIRKLGTGKAISIKITGLSGVSNRPHGIEAIDLEADQGTI
jgi:hypothetical protein